MSEQKLGLGSRGSVFLLLSTFSAFLLPRQLWDSERTSVSTGGCLTHCCLFVTLNQSELTWLFTFDLQTNCNFVDIFSVSDHLLQKSTLLCLCMRMLRGLCIATATITKEFHHFTQTSTAASAERATLLRGRTSLLLRWTWYTFSAETQDRGLSSGGMVTPYSHPVRHAQTMALCFSLLWNKNQLSKQPSEKPQQKKVKALIYQNIAFF